MPGQLQLGHIPGDVVHRADLHVRLAIQHRVSRRREHRDVAVVQIHHRAGVLEHRRRVRRHEQLVVADPQQHRRSLPRHHDLARLRRRHDRQPVRPLHQGQCRDHPRLEGLPRGLLDQVRQGLRVGLGGEAVPGALQHGAQRVGILDDPVVDHGHGAAAIGMGMRIARGGRAVRGPAGVRDPARPVQGRALEQGPERPHAPRQLGHHHAGAVLHRDPGRVVSAVLQPMQPLDQNRRRLPSPHVSDDAAHASEILRAGGRGRPAQQPVAARQAEPVQLRELDDETCGEVVGAERGPAPRAQHPHDGAHAERTEIGRKRIRLVGAAPSTLHRTAMHYQDWGRRRPPVRVRPKRGKRRRCVTAC